MTFIELANFVCNKVGQTEANDVAAAKEYVNRRYELIWNQALWRDALVEAAIAIDPTNFNHAAGIVLLPAELDRVLGARTGNNSVRVNQLELYYRIDFDRFAQTGTPLEFALLAPVWTTWRGVSGLKIVSAASDDGKTIIVRWRDAGGTLHTDSVILNSAQPPTITPDASLNTAVDARQVIISGAGNDFTNGTYALNAASGYFYSANGSFIYSTPDYWFIKAGDTNYTNYEAAKTASPIGVNWTAYFGYDPAPSSTAGFFAEITIESVSKPATTDSITFAAQYSIDANAGTLSATATSSDNCQRLRLFSKPTGTDTLRVLGKRRFSPLVQDFESPAIRNVDNALIAFAHADMLQRMRQYGKAQVIAQEAAALLGQLQNIEAVQQAHNMRIIPDDGFAPEYDNGFGRAF